MIVLSIDPGSKLSGYCFVDTETYEPKKFAKAGNEELLSLVLEGAYDRLIIERIASYGMAVGKEVFQTCEWIGRFTQTSKAPVAYVYRKEEKLCLCGSPRAKDANIRRSLIDRFARNDLKNGKGTKKNQDFFYGFKADCWAAFAVAVTYIEREKEEA